VIAAREGGARIIAIASGSNSTAELANAGADKVFEDLTQTDELLSAIYGDQHQK
jgi:beta-phosphoglucomutase-like phosphatase (HAD superfamily)